MYTYHQSHSQLTLLLFVSAKVRENDLLIIFKENYLVVRLKNGQVLVKGKLFAPINPSASSHILESPSSSRTQPSSSQDSSSGPKRASSLSSSSQNSFEVVSPAGSEKGAGESYGTGTGGVVSLESSGILSNAASSSSSFFDDASSSASAPSSPAHQPTPTDSTTPHSLPLQPSSPTSSASQHSSQSDSSVGPGATRLLTIHLEKVEKAIWPYVISGGCPAGIDPLERPSISTPVPVTTLKSSSIETVVESITSEAAKEEEEEEEDLKFNMDFTSLTHLGCLSIASNPRYALELLLHAFTISSFDPLTSHLLVTHYFPPSALLMVLDNTSIVTVPQAGVWNVEQSIEWIGGYEGLSHLYATYAFLHLSGGILGLKYPKSYSASSSTVAASREAAKRYATLARFVYGDVELDDALVQLLAEPEDAASVNYDAIEKLELKKRRRKSSAAAFQGRDMPIEEDGFSLISVGGVVLALSVLGVGLAVWLRRTRSV